MPALHHIALVCRDPHETHRFYNHLLQFPLVYAEVQEVEDRGWFRHMFYDVGDGSCLAFFDLHGLGEPRGGELYTGGPTALGSGWNHVALRSDPDRVAATKARLDEAGTRWREMDHGWCRSLYVNDPNDVVVELTVDTPGFQPDPEQALAVLEASGPRPGADGGAAS